MKFGVSDVQASNGSVVTGVVGRWVVVEIIDNSLELARCEQSWQEVGALLALTL